MIPTTPRASDRTSRLWSALRASEHAVERLSIPMEEPESEGAHVDLARLKSLCELLEKPTEAEVADASFLAALAAGKRSAGWLPNAYTHYAAIAGSVAGAPSDVEAVVEQLKAFLDSGPTQGDHLEQALASSLRALLRSMISEIETVTAPSR